MRGKQPAICKNNQNRDLDGSEGLYMLNRRSFLTRTTSLALATSLQAAKAADRPVDIALVNATVWTGRPNGGRETAIGITGEHIPAVGADQVRARTAKTTRAIELHGAFAMPAFADNHTLFLRGAVTLTQPNLLDSKD